MSDNLSFSTLGTDEIMFVLIKTTWTNPGEETKLHFQIIAAPRANVDLDDLRQTIQDDFQEHAEEDHPGASMTVEVFDADHVPEGTIPPDAEVTSSEEVVELAKAISTRSTRTTQNTEEHGQQANE